MDARSLAAGVIGVALGLIFLAAPGAVVRAHSVGRSPPSRGGEYGTDGAPADRWIRLVQVVGVALVLGGLYFGAAGLGLV